MSEMIKKKDDVLCHYGVPGMRWGVRRYQNKDGTLTEKGRIKYKEIISSQNIKKQDLEAKESDKKHLQKTPSIVTNVSKGTDIIKKGTQIYRIGNSGESIDRKRKYVSITDYDRGTYSGSWEYLPLDMNKNVSEYTYSAKKKLTVANGKNVADYIVKKYGDKSMKECVQDLEKSHMGKYPYYLPPKEAKKYKWAIDYNKSMREKGHKFIKEQMKKHSDEIVEHYIKKKYDAIVDPEDYLSLYAEYPVIILNPSKSLKMKKENKFFEAS
jgi:hypothetical protein